MKPKTAKTKRASIQPSMTKRLAGAGGLLKIAARLKNQVQKADAGPTWKDRFQAALATGGRIEDFLRALHARLSEGGVEDANLHRVMVAELAETISVSYQKKDAEFIRIGMAVDSAELRHGKKPGEDWPDDQDAPEDLLALWAAGRHRANELMAAVLRHFGEGEMADKLLTAPVDFWDWFKKGQDELQASLGSHTDAI